MPQYSAGPPQCLCTYRPNPEPAVSVYYLVDYIRRASVCQVTYIGPALCVSICVITTTFTEDRHSGKGYLLVDLAQLD